MQSGKKYLSLIINNIDIVINNLIFGLGFALLILGITLLNPGVDKAVSNQEVNTGTNQQVNQQSGLQENQEAGPPGNQQLNLQESQHAGLLGNQQLNQQENQQTEDQEIEGQKSEDQEIAGAGQPIAQEDTLQEITQTDQAPQVTIGELDTSNLALDYNHLYSIDEEIELTIPSGSSGSTVAKIFDKSGIMTEEEFSKYLKLFNIENRIKAGKYTFNKNDSFADILNRILIRR
ncbi:MAG: hypothetical protein ACLFPF_02410 [Halanaerobiales bacterium]